MLFRLIYNASAQAELFKAVAEKALAKKDVK